MELERKHNELRIMGENYKISIYYIERIKLITGETLKNVVILEETNKYYVLKTKEYKTDKEKVVQVYKDKISYCELIEKEES